MTREEVEGVKQDVNHAWEFGNHSLGNEKPLKRSDVGRRWVRWEKDWCSDYFLT